MATQELIVSPQQAAITKAQDFLPVFNIELAIERRDAMISFVKRIMNEGTDFGTIPGTPKPSLLKPGAEKLCTFFGLAPEFLVAECIEDWTGKDHDGYPFFYYRYKCRLTKNGRLISEGEGSCNSWESKYRWRWLGLAVLPPGQDTSALLQKDATVSEPAFAISKAETTGKYGKPKEYWQKFRDAIANGTAKKTTKPKKDGSPMDAWEIPETLFRLPNPDIADVVNTLQKMAQKRALIGAVLVGVNASEYFTQDVEDMQHQQESAGPSSDDFGEAPAQAFATQQAKAPRSSAADATNRAKSLLETQLGIAATRAPEAQEATNTHQSDFEKLLRTTNNPGLVKEFRRMKTDLIELLGKDQGEITFQDILLKHHAEKLTDLYTRNKAVACALDMQAYISRGGPEAAPDTDKEDWAPTLEEMHQGALASEEGQ